MRQRNGGTDSRHRLSNMGSQVVLSIHVHLFFEKVEKSIECLVCMSMMCSEVEMRLSTES